MRRMPDIDQTLLAASKALATRCRQALSKALGNSVVRRAGVHGGHYVDEVNSNLIGCTRDDIKSEFERGAGRELESKMRAPWSSSALCVNSFCRWRCEGEVARLKVGGESCFTALRFERTYAHGIRGGHPHLDAELRRQESSGPIAIESKCLEPVDLSLKTPISVSRQYRDLVGKKDSRCDSKWFAVLDAVEDFVFLDAYQLVKHFLGFVRSGPPGTERIIYLYWQPPDATHEVFVRHREEVARFASAVSGDEMCGFRALTYSEHWHELEELRPAPPWLSEHLAALRARYEIAV
jgi:hypothetical protein